jgi:hypothetical protein
MRHPLSLAKKSTQRPNKKIEPRWISDGLDHTLPTVIKDMAFYNGLIQALLFIFVTWLIVLPSGPMAQEHNIEQSQAAQSATGSPPPHILRGNEVAARFLAFTLSLGEFHQDLRERLIREAPDLAEQLKDRPPQPLVYGYQILPPLTEDEAVSEKQQQVTSTSYSWVHTDKLLDAEYARLKTSRAALQKLAVYPIVEQRRVYEQLVVDYRLLEDNQGLIDEHIQHNRFWQKGVAEDKSRFDHLTALHDAVLERQAVRDRLETETEAKTIKGMQHREQELTAMIHAGRNTFYPPSFITFKRPRPDLLIVQVPLYTDITDPVYLKEWRQAVEQAWQGRVNKTEVRVQLLFTSIQAPDLYRGKPQPRHGDHIEISGHVARFPEDGGVLTTGARATYGITGRSIALGPHGISKNTMAHEFGHILGFIDGYFRGYRDLGEHGYEVLEIVVDPADIMSAPTTGRVLPFHLDKLLTASHEPGEDL